MYNRNIDMGINQAKDLAVITSSSVIVGHLDLVYIS